MSNYIPDRLKDNSLDTRVPAIPISTADENEKLKREVVELKAMVNELHSALSSINDVASIVIGEEWLNALLRRLPVQSLHDHDMAIAEAVREAIASRTGIMRELIRSIDLAPIVNGVK